jgi:hypothetical protein
MIRCHFCIGEPQAAINLIEPQSWIPPSNKIPDAWANQDARPETLASAAVTNDDAAVRVQRALVLIRGEYLPPILARWSLYGKIPAADY